MCLHSLRKSVKWNWEISHENEDKVSETFPGWRSYVLETLLRSDSYWQRIRRLRYRLLGKWLSKRRSSVINSECLHIMTQRNARSNWSVLQWNYKYKSHKIQTNFYTLTISVSHRMPGVPSCSYILVSMRTLIWNWYIYVEYIWI